MASPSLASSAACTCGLCLPEWLADGWRCHGPLPPCPICFEGSPKAWYTDVGNHSWWNSDRCDAHGVCWLCLQRHVETKVLDDGTWHIRCPGPSCRYHLVDEDVRAALHGSARGEEALERRELLRGQSCGSRLEELVASAASDPLQARLMGQCQACPRCFALARREDGCPHLVCRCGTDYCYGCGAPHAHELGEALGCLCGEEDEDLPLCGLWLFKAKRLPGLAHGRCEAVMLAEIKRREEHLPWTSLAELERHEAERREAQRREEAQGREPWEPELARGRSTTLGWLDRLRSALCLRRARRWHQLGKRAL